MGLLADPTEGAGFADIFAAAVEGREVDETGVVFGGLAEILAMLTVLKAEGLFEEGGAGECCVVVYGWFAGEGYVILAKRRRLNGWIYLYFFLHLAIFVQNSLVLDLGLRLDKDIYLGFVASGLSSSSSRRRFLRCGV